MNRHGIMEPTMHYSVQDFEYLSGLTKASTDLHVLALVNMVKGEASYAKLFAYGSALLPDVRDKKTGKVDLRKLDSYQPEIVSYFSTLSELPTLPNRLKDLATDLAIYANGESLQTDPYYTNMRPELEIKKALDEYPEP
jgi:hypothetical protein